MLSHSMVVSCTGSRPDGVVMYAGSFGSRRVQPNAKARERAATRAFRYSLVAAFGRAVDRAAVQQIEMYCSRSFDGISKGSLRINTGGSLTKLKVRCPLSWPVFISRETKVGKLCRQKATFQQSKTVLANGGTWGVGRRSVCSS